MQWNTPSHRSILKCPVHCSIHVTHEIGVSSCPLIHGGSTSHVGKVMIGCCHFPSPLPPSNNVGGPDSCSIYSHACSADYRSFIACHWRCGRVRTTMADSDWLILLPLTIRAPEKAVHPVRSNYTLVLRMWTLNYEETHYANRICSRPGFYCTCGLICYQTVSCRRTHDLCFAE